MFVLCAAFAIVQRMGAGDDPTEACLKVLKMVADHTRAKRLLDEQGRPSFGLSLYALRKDGAFGSAAMWKGSKFSVSDSSGDRLEACAFLYEKKS